MALGDLNTWLDTWNRNNALWYAKRLAANDTLASGAHQAGPYVPKDVLFSVFPSLRRSDSKNPGRRFPLTIDSHQVSREIRAVWYNNKLTKGTRDEARLTNFGGRASPLLDPDSTGALAVFAFLIGPNGEATEARAWLARNVAEEDLIEERIGPVEPGRWVLWSSAHQIKQGLFSAIAAARQHCRLTNDEIPPDWLVEFPTGARIIQKAIEMRPDNSLEADTRLLRRRDCEYEIFRSVEEAVELPAIRKGFDNIDEFMARAQTILQRRKARSGRSLELHVKEILVEEGFTEGTSFSYNPESEPGKRPDFLFPSEAAYKDRGFPTTSLRMLAVKTTCKDRWRQILNEADRVRTKHLLTLQEGVSENQFREMSDAGVQLVVPKNLHSAYPAPVRPGLVTVEAFLCELRS